LRTEGADFLPGLPREQRLAPAPDRHRDHFFNAGMEARYGCKTLLNAPIEGSIRELPPDVARHRKIVDHVTERGSFHEQDTHRQIK
jgi:hypothetical protein